MRTTYTLPMEMRLATGEILKPVIGGTLDNKPFCNFRDWLTEHEDIKAEARRLRLKYRRIGVLSRNLRGKYDLHGRLYRPNVWSFVEVRRDFGTHDSSSNSPDTSRLKLTGAKAGSCVSTEFNEGVSK